ncbi:MAG: dethiobiotin synthase [Planctomycetota bacterium]
MKIVFVSGCGTEVGKTYVACSLIRALRQTDQRVGGYKPVASGCVPAATALPRSADADALYHALLGDMSGHGTPGRTKSSLASLPEPQIQELICPQRFIAPVAPDEAAVREGKRVDIERLLSGVEHWREHCDVLVVEGAGGLFSPIANTMLNIDLLTSLKPSETLLVAPNRLGVIHDVVATVTAAASREVSIDRLILNSAQTGDASHSSNAKQIAHWCPHLKIETIDHGGELQRMTG